MTAKADRTSAQVTGLLLAWSKGDQEALAELLPLVYEELRGMAARHLRRERRAHTLQRTALVHEAFLRLVDQKDVDWQGRAQFFSLASQMMRRILVDYARRRHAKKRGGSEPPLNLDDALAGRDAVDPAQPAIDALYLTAEAHVDLGAVDSALQRLERMDPQQGKLVELRFFGGLSINETASVMGTSPATVKREWAIARAWLHRELGAGDRE